MPIQEAPKSHRFTPVRVPASYFAGNTPKPNFSFQCYVRYPETERTYETHYVWISSTQKISKHTNYGDGRGPQFSSIARLESFVSAEKFLEWVFVDAEKYFNGMSPIPEISYQGDESCHCLPWRKFIIHGQEYWQQRQILKSYESQLISVSEPIQHYCQVLIEFPKKWTARYDYGTLPPVTFALDSVGKIPLFNPRTQTHQDWHCGDLRRAIEDGKLEEIFIDSND